MIGEDVRDHHRMDAAWVGVVGAAVGGLIAVLGQWMVQLRVGADDSRAERRDAYVDFLSIANRGVRAARDLMKLVDTVPAEEQQDELDRLRAEADSYLLEMDRGLVRMQLASPSRILEAGRYLHEGIDHFGDDDLTGEDLDQRYRTFVALAHLDLRARQGLRRVMTRAYLGRFAGLPHRSERIPLPPA